MQTTHTPLVAAGALLGALILAGPTARAGGDPKPKPEPQPEPTYSFNGIAALSGCSGSVFRLEGQSMDDDALVLTNGHCIGLLGEFEVIVNEPTNREVRLFDATDAEAGTYAAKEIVYATMHQTDMAILRLDASYSELAESNIDALMMAEQRGEVGEELAIVSGLWEYVTRCDLDGFVYSMQEDQYTWWDSLRFTQECVTFGGTSGSPVISVATGEIVGVNNTGFEGGEPCSINNPCEIDEQGNITTLTDGSYGQQTFQLYGCVDDAMALDLDQSLCELPRPSGVLGAPSIAFRSELECDDDGNLDAGETAVVAITVANDGPVELTTTSVTITSPSPDVQLGETAADLGTLPPFGTATVEFNVTLADTVTDVDRVEFAVVVSDPNAAAPETTATATLRVNFDDVPNSSATDDVESANVPWDVVTEPSLGDELQWRRTPSGADNTAWHAADIDEMGDQRLESPALAVGDQDFRVSFAHRYRFETSRDTFWDGGVIELSTDDGVTWTDASELATDVGYGGAITAESGNPLADRQAFVGESAGFPATTDAVLDFGTALRGQSVKLRFRIGTDAAAGDFGWEIDDIAVAGITNTPFSTIADDAGSCDDTPDPDPEPMPEPTDPPESHGGCSTVPASRGPAWFALFGVFGLFVLRRRTA